MDFSQYGGTPIVPVGADIGDEAVVQWNFGIAPAAGNRPMQTFYQAYPKLQGRWDGRTDVNHLDAVRKVGIDPEQLIQLQPNGTCGGRSGSLTIDILQCILLASGAETFKFSRASHAWLYYYARRLYNMLRGGEGVASGSIPEAMEKGGLLKRDECGDTNYYGQGSDALAMKLGTGRGNADDIRKWEELAKDNIVTSRVRCESAQECADALASGGVIVQSDSQGFTMERDSRGFCKPRGTWYHYHVRGGLQAATKAFAYFQSWGKNVPSGPVVPGYSSNVFLHDWDLQDSLCRSGEVDAVFAFKPWDLEQGNINIDWVF